MRTGLQADYALLEQEDLNVVFKIRCTFFPSNVILIHLDLFRLTSCHISSYIEFLLIPGGLKVISAFKLHAAEIENVKKSDNFSESNSK